MVHVIQLALGASRMNLGVKGRIQPWEPHERDQQFGEDESTAIGKSQRLRKEGNASIQLVLTMRADLAKKIDKVRIEDILKDQKLTFI